MTRLWENRFTRPVKRLIVRMMAAKCWLRRVLNHYYNLLGDQAKSRFHARYAKLFREQAAPLAGGHWNVYFIDRRIKLPLRPSWSWLDWDGALSIVGHDIEVKQTYAALIGSHQRPGLFIDIGSNYGMHSILWLASGIPVIAFEPNPHCLPHFETVCRLNDLSGRWEQIAVGDENGEVELVYPESETWLGSVSTDVVVAFRPSDRIISRRVPMRRLDDYLGEIARDDILMKIDVEGFEREVVRGASQFLRTCRPKVIFESNDRRTRGELFRLFAIRGYRIQLLPWRPLGPSRFLLVDEFIASDATNFMAMPFDPSGLGGGSLGGDRQSTDT